MDSQERIRASAALVLVIGLSVWHINEVPQGDSNWPMSLPVYAAFWVACGAIWGRWKSLVLPIVLFAIVTISGVETNPVGDQNLWVYTLTGAVIVGLPFTAIGVGLRRFVERRKAINKAKPSSN
jgi:hypothetical protein